MAAAASAGAQHIHAHTIDRMYVTLSALRMTLMIMCLRNAVAISHMRQLGKARRNIHVDTKKLAASN